MGTHEYFNRSHTEWSIIGFLTESDEESFQLKIGVYLKNLENIINHEQGARRDKAQLLYDNYKKAITIADDNVDETETLDNHNNKIETRDNHVGGIEIVDETEDDKSLEFDFNSVVKSLQQKPLNEWKVHGINVTRKFREYQQEVLETLKTTGVTWYNTYEILQATAPMIIAIDRRIKYQVHFLFVLRENLPDLAPQRTSEDEHCRIFLNPYISPIFLKKNNNYEVQLNRAVKGTKQRPDLSCVMDNVPLLNAEIKPMGSRPLNKKKDVAKVYLRAKTINQQLTSKGGPGETACSSIMFAFDRIKPYFVVLERRVCELAKDYKRRKGQFTPPLQIQYMRSVPDSPQIRNMQGSYKQ
ncbi:hypothetical protein F8M41_007489 [Gigaspora margarita]|uniref:Uncharacterized protein n=1 Tax=Gigaspora margarita TaxID=4874 RepID=A0A8H3X6R1_GIGMA|nr:hypothetical protein F8M41_007489 [Gigaspora margarita]